MSASEEWLFGPSYSKGCRSSHVSGCEEARVIGLIVERLAGAGTNPWLPPALLSLCILASIDPSRFILLSIALVTFAMLITISLILDTNDLSPNLLSLHCSKKPHQSIFWCSSWAPRSCSCLMFSGSAEVWTWTWSSQGRWCTCSRARPSSRRKCVSINLCIVHLLFSHPEKGKWNPKSFWTCARSGHAQSWQPSGSSTTLIGQLLMASKSHQRWYRPCFLGFMVISLYLSEV